MLKSVRTKLWVKKWVKIWVKKWVKRFSMGNKKSLSCCNLGICA